MIKFIARRAVRQFGARYSYDVEYLEALLDASPSAFLKFVRAGALARHREQAPLEAFFAAKLVGALVEDCGPCVQLIADMAREAGVADEEIAALLTGKRAAMSDAARAGYDFAAALVRRDAALDETRERVRALWGPKGVVDLTLAAQSSRLYPVLKAGLGFTKECVRIRVAGQALTVVAPR